MRAIDTNVLVRLLARDDPRQTDAAESFVAKGAWVSHLVLMETVWVLDSVYEVGHGQIGTAIEMLLNHEDLILEDADVVATALEKYRHRPRLSFSDCLILEVARKAGHTPLGTFDRDLGKVEGTERL
jgi:predicted nucleic-acid-binding protein